MPNLQPAAPSPSSPNKSYQHNSTFTDNPKIDDQKVMVIVYSRINIHHWTDNGKAIAIIHSHATHNMQRPVDKNDILQYS